ncbi:MAG: response regulator [Deltaproteobacteria bacterium]|nr:response regulator [Deltaproteobacteria bacterium]
MVHDGSKGKPEYLSTVMRDISERKAAEAERERLQDRLNQVQKLEALGTLAGGVAHDFNNILQAIGGSTQALLKDKASGARDHARLKTIERSVERAAELVRRLLIFSRKAESQRVLVDLNWEIEDAVMVLTQTIPRMIEVVTDLEPSLWPIHADPVQIEQMLFNLATNAADAMPQGGVLSLSTSNRILEEGEGPEDLSPGPYVRLTVADTGRGMSRRIMDKMFEPFFTTKEVGKGTGLGLASVYGIVTDHGGAIVCDSIIGRGTTFTIFLPADPTAVRPEPSTSPETQIFRSGRETILIVDDEADLRDLTMEALSDAGYEVLEAAGGEEALSVFEANQERVALVLLDLNMPGMGGHQCLLELLALNPKVRVIIASGYALNDQVRVSLEAGAAAFQGKPFKIGELLTLVREVLDRPSQ